MKQKNLTTEKALRGMFWAFAAVSLVAAFLMTDRGGMLEGLARICTQSGQVVKSYFDPSYGGFAGTFLNVALVCAVCAAIYCLPGAKPDGLSVLAFFLTAGFSFWGTTILNIWFSIAGVLLYCLVKRQKPGAMANAMLFSTGIGPLITDMLFRYPGADWHGFTLAGVLIALAVGVFIGFLLPAGLPHSPKMHKGYDLYSAAVPIGLTAFFLRSLLYKVFGGVLPESVNVGTDASFPLISYGFCILVFGIAILAALGMGADFRRYGALLKDSGYNVDFAQKYGTETALLNFGVYGLFIVLYYTLIGASWNAATLGCVFCMVCCCFKGSHPGNVLPIMIGYVLSSFGAKAVCSLTGAEFSMAINAQAIVIGLCFANGLSPLTGAYGWLAGIVAGIIHYIFVTCVPLLHGAFCLYNGGFTAAFTCFLFIPVLEHFCRTKEERKASRAKA